MAQDFKQHVQAIADFPSPGILFRDITPLLRDIEALRSVIDTFAARYESRSIDAVLGIESRGFLFGVPLALALGCSFVPLRKAGKLPPPTRRLDYDLEYGSAALEIKEGDVAAGQRVVIIDDLLATGGTAAAAATLVAETGATIEEVAFFIELEALQGRDALAGYDVYSLIRYGADEA